VEWKLCGGGWGGGGGGTRKKGMCRIVDMCVCVWMYIFFEGIQNLYIHAYIYSYTHTHMHLISDFTHANET